MVRVGVTVRMDFAISVAVLPERHRVKVDPRVLDGRFGLGAIAFRVVAGKPAPGLQAPSAARRPRSALGAPRARYACIHRV